MFIILNTVEKLSEETHNLSLLSAAPIDLGENNSNLSLGYIKYKLTEEIQKEIERNAIFTKIAKMESLGEVIELYKIFLKILNPLLDIDFSGGFITIYLPKFFCEIYDNKYVSTSRITTLLENNLKEKVFINENMYSLIIKRFIATIGDCLLSFHKKINQPQNFLRFLCLFGHSKGVDNKILEDYLIKNNYQFYLNTASILGLVIFFDEENNVKIVGLNELSESNKENIFSEILKTNLDNKAFINLVILFSNLTLPSYFKDFGNLMNECLENTNEVSLLFKILFYNKEYPIMNDFQNLDEKNQKLRFINMGCNIRFIVKDLLTNTYDIKDYQSLKISLDEFKKTTENLNEMFNNSGLLKEFDKNTDKKTAETINNLRGKDNNTNHIKSITNNSDINKKQFI